MDKRSDEAFVFDVCSFYGHNEYDTGNWRAPRHRLSHKDYIKNYKLRFAPSEPAEDWDARNLLYSLTFNIGNTIYIPGSTQRLVVYEDMTTLCKMFCPEELKQKMETLRHQSGASQQRADEEEEQATVGAQEPQEEEEEEEEEELDWKT